MNKKFLINPNEKKIRLLWLIIYNAINALACFYYLYCHSMPGELLIFGVFSYFFFYCAYKKFGTALLALNLILEALYCLLYPIILYFKFPTCPISTYLIDLMTFLIPSALFFWINFKMRLANKAIQHRNILSTNEYQNAVTLIGQSTDLSDLKQKFHTLIHESARPQHFFGAFVDAVKKIYQEKESSLKQIT